jgi:hypothetical protein
LKLSIMRAAEFASREAHRLSTAVWRRSWRRPIPRKGDLASVPTKGAYVIPDPFERGDLVEKVQVSDAVA